METKHILITIAIVCVLYIPFYYISNYEPPQIIDTEYSQIILLNKTIHSYQTGGVEVGISLGGEGGLGLGTSSGQIGITIGEGPLVITPIKTEYNYYFEFDNGLKVHVGKVRFDLYEEGSVFTYITYYYDNGKESTEIDWEVKIE